jgi:DNA polymerase
MVTAKIIGGHHVHSKRVGILADFETRSPVDLKVHGASRYARDLRTEVMCLCVADVYARTDDRGYVVDRSSKKLWRMDSLVAKDVFIPSESELLFAYNAEFEYLIYTQCWGVELRPSQMYCIQVQGLYNGLPAGLDKLSNAAAFTVVKDKEGHDLMVKMSKQREDGTYLYDQEKMERLCTYCIADIECEAEALEKLRPLPPYELRCYQETLAINIAGIPIDMELVLSAREMNEVVGAELQAMYPDINLKSHAQIKAFAKNFGYTLVSTDKEHVADALEDPAIPGPVKDLLEIKAMGVGSSSVSKFDALVNFTDDDGYLRGSYRHHGAIRTGRWTSQGVQIQNLPRGEKAQLKVIAELRELIRARDVDGLYLMSGMRPMDALRTSIRTMFAAPRGWVFVQRDLAAIEARGVTWVAKARNLKIFTEFDAKRGEEPYMIFADLLGVDRFLGKVSILSSGYQVGTQGFINMLSRMGRKIDDTLAKRCLDTYKEMFPEVKEFWGLVDAASKGAVETPGVVTLVETPANPIKFLHDGKNLMLRLPSERVLTYWGARLEPGKYGKVITHMTYGAEDKKAQGWHKTSTFGGAITGHIVQGFSACIMRDISLRLREAGIPACMLVHDEAVCLVREEDAQKTFDKMTEIMNMTPAWAKGLPVKSAGWIGNFFVKD